MKNMKHLMFVLLTFALFAPMSVGAQDWNKEAYPDYDPNYSNPDPVLMKFGKIDTRKKAKAAQAAAGLPDHVNNANSKYFPPVFNQDGGSCGSASRIAYMFTHELNAYRDVDGSTTDHNYPTHFVWLLTNGRSGKDAFVQHVGVPSSKTYGGRTYSALFGYQEETYLDFGWMTGYDKWFEAFGNRMNKPTTNPYSLGTEEGRLAAKAWLYNHAGDESFHCGGLIGLGVASGGNWKKIPSTAVNDSIGVTDMYYVYQWGTQVDHALTMVGYDDRIQFDLDGNGVYGEEEKDEVGAWIIVNSWGQWCNKGFIYCPYAYGGSNFKSDGTFSGNWWYGELYHTRKDYRPLRTIKLKMDYSRRSELLLQAGVSADLTATKPESVIDMHHFRYAGDGRNGDSIPAPEVPMLGKWADGKLHDEPMEFGYDLTDLSSGYDRNQALKYFFIINTKPVAVGEGHIYEASIMDYEYDLEGVETPFDLGSDGVVDIKNAGNQTIISVIVYGAAFNAPQNIAAVNGNVVWEAPILSGHQLKGYAVYRDGVKLGTVGADVLTYAMTESGTYGVAAIYENNLESAQATVVSTIQKQEENLVVNLEKSGFTIPGIFNNSYEECTIEYYIKPNSLTNYNNAFGPGWGSFLAHCNSSGAMSVGWNTGGHRIDASSSKLKTGVWTHVSIVVSGSKMTLYMGTNQVGSVTSSNFSGIGGFGDLVFSASSGSNYYQDASYDEIRIWNRARTAAEIKATYNREFYGEVQPDGLMAYYKGDVIEIDGASYLRDCVGGHHALISNVSFTEEAPTKQPALYRPKDSENILTIDEPAETVYAGIPVTLTTTRGDGIQMLVWKVADLSISDWHITNPSITFPKAGTYEVEVTGTDYEGDAPSGEARTITATRTITVVDAPALDASFTATATEVASGDRISFKVNNPITGYAYVWSMPGADVETVNTLAAAATYQGAGTFTVTLTATSPSGAKAQESMDIKVSEVAPEADFTLSDAVVLKGNNVTLTSTSKHKPTDVEWTLNGTVQKLTVTNAPVYNYTTEEPGVYSISLKATNDVGSDTKKQDRALIVVNADSKNGLSFNQSAARVYLTNLPFANGDTKLSIDWWMNPGKLVDYCQGIGEGTSTFLLRTDANGTMYFHNGNKKVNTDKGYVIAGQWHHYAIVYNRGAVKFFRDGELIKNVSSGAGTSLTAPTYFSIGTSSAEMSGSIDEFRIWGNTLTESIFQGLGNQPIEDVEDYVTGDHKNYKLKVYYQFNQSGGNVADLSSNANEGVRTGFGPDGDAWGLSRGVFCLNFGDKQDDVVIDGIEGVATDEAATSALSRGIYTLSGQRVNEKAVNLRPGIYVINGKKTVVK